MKINTNRLKKHNLFKYILLISLLCIGSFGTAQTNEGTDFWIAETHNLVGTGGFTISVVNSGAVTANITITNPTIATINAAIPPGVLQNFDFGDNSINGQGIFTDNVYHVTSDNPVAAYSFAPLDGAPAFSADASLILPVTSLGKRYRVGTYNTGSFIGIVGTEDATNVQIFNPDGFLLLDVDINQGEYYRYVPGADVTGWLVSTDKNVATYGGHICTNIGNGFCDHIYEQLLPEEAISSSFIACPTRSRPIDCTTDCLNDIFRYVATEDNTTITTSPDVGGGTLNAGQFIEIQTDIPHVVTASRPLYGYQFLTGSTNSVGNLGDPAMLNVPPVEQFLFEYTFLTPPTYAFDFINVVAPSGTNFLFDGSTISPTCTDVGVIDGLTYCCFALPVTDGVHSISADQKFGLSISGFDESASYAYIGGLGLQPFNAGCNTGGPYSQETCNISGFQLDGTATCSDGSTPTSVLWSSSNPEVTFSDATIEDPVAILPDYGTYDVTFTVTCTDTNGVEQSTSCTSTITVTSPEGQVIPNAGTDGTLTVCQGTTPTDEELFAQLSDDPDTNGVWSGPDDNGVYTYTVNVDTPCPLEDSATVTVTENPLPSVDFTGPGDQQANSGVLAGLSGGTPLGGVYSGDGVTDNGNGETYSFDTAALDGGPVTITYTYTDANDCTNSASDDVGVTLSGPPNDLCEDAEPIACDDTVVGSTINATDSGGNSSSPDVYYELAGTSVGEVITASLCGSSFDTFMTVLDACNGNPVASNDDFCELQSEVSFISDGLTTYIIRVEGFGTASGDFELSIECVSAPDNDFCMDAELIECGDTVSGTTTNSTFDDAGFCGTTNTAPGVWYSFLGIDGNTTLSTCSTADFDTKLSVFTGACDDLTCVDGNDDGVGCTGFTSELTIPTIEGVEYYVLVHGFGSAEGDFDLSITCEGADPCDTPGFFVWTGAVSSDWTDPGNWLDGNAPGLSVYGEVNILGGVPNYPVLTQDLYVSECGIVFVDPGTSITVRPNVELTNDGVVDNFSGAVIFESDDTGSAYNGPGAGLFFGDYTVERYIPAKRAYRQLASPVFTSEPISENWQQDTHITGPAGNTDGFDVTQTGNPSAYIFNNDTYVYEELENTNATNLMPGTMYHILIRGDRNTDLTNNDAPPSVTTLRATGTLDAENVGGNTVSVNVPEQRFVAFGNPFQSQVDMNYVLNNSTFNIDNVFYWVWDPTLGTRGAYAVVDVATGVNSSSDSEATPLLQAGQSAWVYTSGAGLSEVVIDQSAKDNSQVETDIFRNGSTTNQGQLRLSLYESGALANGENATDAVLVLFDSNGNNGVDAYDAVNITNLDENFATNNDGVLLSIENRATPVDEDEIPLEINTYRSTNYTIVAQGTAIQGATAFLYDAYLNVHTEIPATGIVNYDYTVNSSLPGTVANNRFKIVFSNSVLSIDDLDIANVLMYPNPTNLGMFYLNVPLGMDDLEVTIYDVLGVELYNKTGFNSGMEITINLGAEFSMGTYFVHLNSQGKKVTKKLIIN